MRRKSFGLRYEDNDLFGQQVGFNGGYAEALNAFCFVERAYQIDETLLAESVTDPKIARVYTRQHNFLHASLGKVPRGVNDMVYGVATAAPPRKRDGAKAARIVAAVLNLQKSACA